MNYAKSQLCELELCRVSVCDTSTAGMNLKYAEFEYAYVYC